MTYKISSKASEYLESIWLFTYKNWSLELADRYLELIFNEIEYLAANPTTGKDFSYVRKNYRSAKVKAHIIYYRIIENSSNIEIIRILHQLMDIENRLNEK